MNELKLFALSAEVPRFGVMRWLRRLRYLDDIYQAALHRLAEHKAKVSKQPSEQWKAELVALHNECEALCEEMCSIADKVDTDAREILHRCTYRRCRLERAIKRRRVDPDVPILQQSDAEEMGDVTEDEKSSDETIKYCRCYRPAFGKMIACDNRDCAIEWYHIECVGLADIPTGKWFCPSCREK